MKLDRKIVLKQRRYELTLPKEILMAMGWVAGKENEKVDIYLGFDPVENVITLKPLGKKPRGMLGFYLALQDIRWKKNPKTYMKELERKLSREARAIKHNPAIWGDPKTAFFEEVELEEAKENLKRLRESHKGLENTPFVKEWIKDAQERVKYYEQKLKFTQDYLNNKKHKKNYKKQEVKKQKK